MTNNPALTAITLMMGEEVAEPKSATEIHVLSLGTGRTIQFIEGDKHDWGLAPLPRAKVSAT